MKLNKNDRKIVSAITWFLALAALLLPIVFKIYSYFNEPLLDPRGKEWKPTAWVIESYKPIVVPQVVKAQEPIIYELTKEKFFNIIWSHESSKGRNNNPAALHMYCRSIGKWNEIGYNPQKKHCFESKDEAINFVNGYIDRNCSNKSLNECLCRWNTGKFTATCPYASGDLANAN